MLASAGSATAQEHQSGADLQAQSNGIFEWVDEDGRKHAADVVPERFKGSAKRIDPADSRISASEQAEALTQAAKLKERAAALGIEPVISNNLTQPPIKASNKQKPSAATCAAWRQRYAESRDCFVGTINRRGKSTYHSCANEYVPDPETVCGR